MKANYLTIILILETLILSAQTSATKSHETNSLKQHTTGCFSFIKKPTKKERSIHPLNTQQLPKPTQPKFPDNTTTSFNLAVKRETLALLNDSMLLNLANENTQVPCMKYNTNDGIIHYFTAKGSAKDYLAAHTDKAFHNAFHNAFQKEIHKTHQTYRADTNHAPLVYLVNAHLKSDSSKLKREQLRQQIDENKRAVDDLISNSRLLNSNKDVIAFYNGVHQALLGPLNARKTPPSTPKTKRKVSISSEQKEAKSGDIQKVDLSATDTPE